MFQTGNCKILKLNTETECQSFPAWTGLIVGITHPSLASFLEYIKDRGGKGIETFHETTQHKLDCIIHRRITV